MPRPNEACSNCFFSVPTDLGLSCNWDTPKTNTTTVLLWPIVKPTDWCGAYSNTGQAVYRTENVPPVFVWDAAVTFAGYGALFSRFYNWDARITFAGYGALFTGAPGRIRMTATFAAAGSFRPSAIKLP